MGIRIQLRLGTVVPNDEYLDVGEGMWDPENNRLGFGTGNAQPLWYPGLDPINKDLILDDGSLIRSEYGGARARFGWDAEDRFSLYTFSGLRLRISDTATNFYNRVNFNAGGTLAGDIDTAGGRFTDINMQTITVSSTSQRILIKDGDTGSVVGRIDEKGVTGKSLQKLFMILAANQENTNQIFRNMFSSGVIAVRSHLNTKAFNPKTKVTDTGFSAITAHNHPDWRGVCGLAEMSVLINGYHLQTRHNDYRMARSIKSNTFAERSLNTGVPVPQSVRDLPLGYTGTVLNGNLTGTQVEWMRNVYTKYKENCVFELAYIEMWIEKFDQDFIDRASSTRHSSITRDFQKLLDYTQYYIRSGYKHPSENLPLPAGVVCNFDANGHPILGYVNWRISSVPVATLSNQLVNMTMDGVNYNLRALPFELNKCLAGIVDASNRFTLRRNLRARYINAGAPQTIIDEREKFTWEQIYKSNRAMFDCADLEELCRLVPGFNGVNDNTLQYEGDPFNSKIVGNRRTGLEFSPYQSLMGMSYYNNKYIVNSTDAVGLHTLDKGFSDANLFTAKCSFDNVLGGHSFMIPLELVLRTPRENWNPFNVANQEKVTGTGEASKPYSGWNDYGTFFTIPEDSIIKDASKPFTQADTRLVSYMSTPSGIMRMLATGVNIFDYDGHRRRFPVVPNAVQFSGVGADLEWLKHALKPLLKKIASGEIADDEIDDAF